MTAPSFPFKIQLVVIVLITLVMLTVIGIITYFRLTYIVNNVEESAKPNVKIVFLKQITTDLAEAESTVKSYKLTRNSSYLRPFFNSVFIVNNKIKTLNKLCIDNEEQRIMCDSIQTLISRKYSLLNHLLLMEDEEKITDELKRISKKINAAEKSSLIVDSLQMQLSAFQAQEESKKGFFKKMFEKNKTSKEVREYKPVHSASAIVIEPRDLMQEINNVSQDQFRQLQERKHDEFNLMLKDKEIMEKIHYWVGRMEASELAGIAQKIRESQELGRETKVHITIFCFAAIVMLLLASILIAAYIKNNNAYRLELQKAKSDAENLAKAEEQFLANMSHEIRTPMNAIIGFTDLILKTELKQEQKQYVNAVKTSGENLLVIINDILDFSKIQAGKFTFEKIDFSLSKQLKSLVELMLPKSTEKGIAIATRIQKDIPDGLVGDPTRLNQIFINLLGNAIKFTHEGEILVTAEAIAEDETTVDIRFSVCDTGIGISPDKLSVIFDGFTQASSETNRKYGGTGLGLSIAKQLVELQGGSIDVKSTLGKGSVFSFNIPFHKSLKPESNALTEYTDVEDKLLKGIKVLLVEDNPLNQMLAKKVLSDWEWFVDTAENGVMAVEKVKQKDYDLILMDIQMPEMDGYEATRLIRRMQNDIKKDVPIVAMTAHALPGELEKCISAGMNDYISKPFSKKVLYAKVLSIFENKQLATTK
ncbi:MAG: ATP-binding protein [Bacteroidia bacterium]|jgi:signal transduction histidine kinase/ActR/RegA family two-component response regulator